jgi:hypothetical protein
MLIYRESTIYYTYDPRVDAEETGAQLSFEDGASCHAITTYNLQFHSVNQLLHCQVPTIDDS